MKVIRKNPMEANHNGKEFDVVGYVGVGDIAHAVLVNPETGTFTTERLGFITAVAEVAEEVADTAEPDTAADTAAAAAADTKTAAKPAKKV